MKNLNTKFEEFLKESNLNEGKNDYVASYGSGSTRFLVTFKNGL